MWSLLCLSLSMGRQPWKRWYFTISQNRFKIKTSASVVCEEKKTRREQCILIPYKTKAKGQRLKTTFHFLHSGPRLFLTFKPLRVPLTDTFYDLCTICALVSARGYLSLSLPTHPVNTPGSTVHTWAAFLLHSSAITETPRLLHLVVGAHFQ